MGLKIRCVSALLLLITALVVTAFSDDAMRKMIDDKKYEAAVKHGEGIAEDSRTVDVWLMLATAYENVSGDAHAATKARNAYEGAMKANPSHPGVYLMYGAFEYKVGNYKAAVGHYQKGYLLGGGAGAAEGIAMASAKLKDWERARDAAESAIAINPDALESHTILAEILFNAKSYGAAAPHLEYVASKKSKDIETWKKLVICYENTKDRDKLAAVDAQIIALDAKDIKSRQRLADYSLEKGDTKTALKIYKELALLTPSDPKPFKNLYKASLEDGNKKDGIMYLRNFVVLDSSDADAVRQLADLLYENKEMDAALDEYRKAARLNPSVKGIYKNYAALVLDKKLDDEALRVIQKAIAIKEADVSMYIAAGDIYRKRNDNANAIKMYQAAMEQDKQNLGLLTKLAEAQAAAGDTRNAIVSYEQIVMLNQNATKEYKTLAELTTKSGKTKEGMDLYKKYLAKVSGDQEISLRVGLYEYGNKQYKNAIDYLTKVTDQKQITTEALVALGDSYNKLQDCKQAIIYFERVRASNPPASVSANILKPLAECYEKGGDKAKAANAYSAYTALPNVKDAEASYLKAYLREDTDLPGAIKMYEANTKEYPRDHRSFMRLGLLYAKDNAALPQAVSNLRAASALTDTVSIIWKTLGEVYGKQKNAEGELNAYTKFLGRQPNDLVANRRVGTIHIERKQYAAGIPYLEKVVVAKSDDFEATMMLAVGYANTGKPKEAAAMYRKAKALRPDDVAIRLSLIETLEKAKDDVGVREEKKSLAELDRKLAIADKKNIESRQRLVAYCRANNDNASAYIFLNELAALTPKEPTVFQNLYDLAIADGKKKEAAEHLKKYIALKPGSADALKSLGLLLYGEKDFDGAQGAFREARKLDPAIKEIYKPYMTILIQKKLNDEIITVGSAAIAAKEADAAVYTAMGDIYRGQSKFADAAKMYKGALDIDTKNTTLLSLYAECLAKSGDLKSASITYEQVILMNPGSTKELKELGAIQVRLGNVDQGMSNYRKYLDKNPADEEVALIVANFEHGRKEYKNAVKYFEMVKKPDLQTPQYFANLADCYYQQENYKKAAELYTRVWKAKNVQQATLKTILNPLAIALEKDGQAAKAAEAYAAYVGLPGVVDQEASYKRAYLIEATNQEQAVKGYNANVKSFPRDSRNFVRLGVIYSQKGETLDQSAANLNAAVKLVDNNADVWLLLAQVNGRLKRTDAELAAYRRYSSLNSKDLTVSRRIGEIFYEKKQWTEAITNLELFLTTNDKDVKVLLMLVDAYEATNRQAKATELLAKAKDLNDKDPGVRERLYNMYKKEGQRQKAESEIRDLVSITKNNKHRLMLCNDLIDAQKYDEAASVVAEVRKSDPLNFDGLMMAATVQRLQRKYPESIETYKSVLYLNDRYAPAYSGRGDAHLGMNEFDRAEGFYKRALELDPKLASAALGLAKVYKAQNKRDQYNTYLNMARLLDPNSKALQDELKTPAKPAASAPADANKAAPAGGANKPAAGGANKPAAGGANKPAGGGATKAR